ncbi:MAG: ATP-binding protein [Dehalococcoidia bacterium]
MRGLLANKAQVIRAPGLTPLLRGFKGLNLWPRLVIAVTVGFLILFGIFSLLSLKAVNDSTERILTERLVITQMAAREIDRLLERGFHELEKATEFAAFDPDAPSLTEEAHMLAHAYGRVGTLSLGVYFLDTQGRVVLSEPPGKLPQGADLSGEAHINKVKETGTRSVSDPFVDPTTGKPAVALTIPIFNSDGARIAMLSGLIDLSSEEILGSLRHSRDIGQTGHAELVDSRGLIVASTDFGAFLKPGEHIELYLRMFQTGETGVETVPYVPWHATAEEKQDEHHVMAFVPLSSAPWGMAVGGTDRETFAPVTTLRNTILLAGAVSLIILWVLTLIGARLLVRPVTKLTGNARQMAAGNLEQPIHVGEGGEIGALADSLEAMRVQLKESMGKALRWGEELETKVRERTEELTARNRQLAAVSAVATVANEFRDLEGMLNRCLEVTLEHSRMETAVVRLLDGQDNRLAVACARGDFSDFPCRDRAVDLGECPCGEVASKGAPLYLSPTERKSFRPSCRAPEAHAVAVLPLKSSKGLLGVLYLSRRQEEPPGPEERETLAAICNQLGIAIENARLVRALGQVQAQQELDRMKAEFISAISHELRTPLGFIKGYATTLLRDDIAVDPAEQREFLQIVDEEANKLQRMIDELLDASRLQGGRLQMDRRPVSLKELLEGALHKAALNLQQKGYTLVAQAPRNDVEVLVDSSRIEQVLHNLLDNAVRYSDPGSQVELGVTIENKHAVVSVKDHGDGVPPEELERIFEPFYRGKSSRERGTKGTGLGLAICRGIIESHGGKLWIESSPGKGSIFFCTLPLVAGDAAENRGQKNAEKTMKKGTG